MEVAFTPNGVGRYPIYLQYDHAYTPAGKATTQTLTARTNWSTPDNRINATGVFVRPQRKPDRGVRGTVPGLRRSEPVVGSDGEAANRVSAAASGGQSSSYAYDSHNRRIYSRDANNNGTVYFCGSDGQKLAAYTYTIITYNRNPEIQLTQQSEKRVLHSLGGSHLRDPCTRTPNDAQFAPATRSS